MSETKTDERRTELENRVRNRFCDVVMYGAQRTPALRAAEAELGAYLGLEGRELGKILAPLERA